MLGKLAKLSVNASNVEQANFSHLVWDIAWFGLAAAATSRFLSVFAIRLGADATDLAWMTALPALILMISSTMTGFWVRRFSSVTRALFLPGLFYRFVFLLPAFAPLVPDQWQPAYLIVSASLPALVQGIAATIFSVMMRSAVHDNIMPMLLSRRSMALNIAVAIGALAFGIWLEHSTFPQNYQLMYILAFAAGLLSLRHCMAVNPTPNACPLNPPRTEKADVHAKPWRSPGFRKVAVCIIIAYIAYFVAYPLVPLHLVENLGASEGFIALYGIVELAAGAAVGIITTRVSARIGNRSMIGLAMVGTAVSSLIVAISPILPLTLVAAALAGASWTAVAMVGLFSYFTENAPSEHMSSYSRAYHQVMGIAMFIGPMLGSFMSRSGFDLVTILLIGAAVRLVAAPIIDHKLVGTVKVVSIAVLRPRRAD